MNRSLRGSLLLLLTAVIWGLAFVAQSDGMNYIGPYTFNTVRYFVAAAVLAPCILLLKRKKTAAPPAEATEPRYLWPGALCCGGALFVASSMQQIGIVETSAGKTGFITATYIVLVPVLGLFLKKRASGWVWLSVAIALGGLYLLCITGSFTMAASDLVVLGGAFFFAIQILVVDYFSSRVDAVRMSQLQFIVAGGLSLVCALIFEKSELSAIWRAGWSILFTGVFSNAIAYTLQIVGQKDTRPEVAALIMSLESVFAVLGGWLMLQERFTGREFLGCLLMFAAILLSQLPARQPKASAAAKK